MRPIFALLLCVLVLNSSSVNNAIADPGPAPAGTAIAEYDFSTGEIIVSVDSVINWYVESSSASLSGPDGATPPLPLAGGAVGDSDSKIGESSLPQFTYTDINLGQVALPGLPLSDLLVYWNPSLGEGPFSQPVVYTGIPEPSSLVLGVFSTMAFLFSRRTYRF